jgi:deoxyribose-phosphate aldolase
MTKQQDALLAVELMDLTSLNTSDTTKDIQALINSIRPALGTPAAVCVFSDFVDDA